MSSLPAGKERGWFRFVWIGICALAIISAWIAVAPRFAASADVLAPAINQMGPAGIDVPAEIAEERRSVSHVGQAGAQAIMIVLACGMTIICVLIHYEALRIVSKVLTRWHGRPRARVIGLIFGVLLAHFIEVWVFALGFYMTDGRGGLGLLRGDVSEGPLDYVYFSVSTYTSVGFGDLVPVGPIRVLAGAEALAGLVLVAWSASFTFLEMQRHWRKE